MISPSSPDVAPTPVLPLAHARSTCYVFAVCQLFKATGAYKQTLLQPLVDNWNSATTCTSHQAKMVVDALNELFDAYYVVYTNVYPNDAVALLEKRREREINDGFTDCILRALSRSDTKLIGHTLQWEDPRKAARDDGSSCSPYLLPQQRHMIVEINFAVQGNENMIVGLRDEKGTPRAGDLFYKQDGQFVPFQNMLRRLYRSASGAYQLQGGVLHLLDHFVSFQCLSADKTIWFDSGSRGVGSAESDGYLGDTPFPVEQLLEADQCISECMYMLYSLV